MNVLLIDHDAESRMAMRLLLEAMDTELFLHEFRSPEEALESSLHLRTDLVMIEHDMPSMDAIRFAKEFRLAPEHRDVPILMVTDKDDKHLHDRAKDAGIVDVVLKQIHARDAHKTLLHWLEHRRSTASRADDSTHKTSSLKERIEDAWSTIKRG